MTNFSCFHPTYIRHLHFRNRYEWNYIRHGHCLDFFQYVCIMLIWFFFES